MNVLALSRQLGCRGDEIAKSVARQLNWNYMDHQLINRAAREAKVPEVALAHIDELGFLGLKPSPQEQRAYLNQIEAIVRELARDGNVVIVGCAVQVILAQHPQTIHVQIIAPLEARVTALMIEKNISETAAMQRILTSDRKRATYLKQNYGVDWRDSSLYDLIINTTRVPPDAAVLCITELIRRI